MTFAIGVFAFTLRAVGQDNFEDVIVPDTPKQQQPTQQPQQQQPPKTPNVQPSRLA